MKPAPLSQIARNALLACASNIIPYTIAMLLGIATTLVTRVTFLNDTQSLEFFGMIVQPIIIGLCYALASQPRGQRKIALYRAFERAWALILIEFILSSIESLALSTVLAGSMLNAFLGGIFLSATAFLLFADVDAVVGSHTALFSLIPVAFVRSVQTVARQKIYLRAYAILIAQVLIYAATFPLTTLFAHRLSSGMAVLAANLALAALTTLPLAVFTVFVYLEAAARESPS